MTSKHSHDEIIERIMTNVRWHMSGGDCPTPGCIGECAIISAVCPTHDGNGWVYSSECYIHDDNFNDSELLASWFRICGASGVTVAHVLYDEDNGDRNGRSESGRAWNVDFVLDGKSPAGAVGNFFALVDS